jgi:ribonucleoside-triphosphate reductase
MNISQSQEVRKKTILSEVIRSLKYARYLPEVKRRETWEETVERNVKMHVRKFPFLEEEIRQVYQGVLGYLYLPSMRSLQFGLDAVEKNNTRIYNCAYVPIIDVPTFGEIMFVLLSGCGVGFSVRKYHVSQLPKIQKMASERTWLIDDSIEGWADAVKALISGYLELGVKITFDYSAIRPEGAELKTSGGKAPGPEPLKRSLNDIETILAGKSAGDSLTTLDCHDIVCMLSEAVYAGGIRRSALLSLFSEDDEDMLNAKSGEWYLSPRGKHRARANNSVCFFRDRVTKEDFLRVWADVKKSGCGEPGIYFSKTQGDGGVNPCNEAYLEPYQFCNLTEVNVSDVLTQEDLDNRVKGAAFIGTLQASYTNFTYLRPVWKKTTERDALLGVGMTGIGSGRVLALDLKRAAQVVIKENERVAKLLGINPAARTTLLKPSGSSSLLLDTASGVHAWHAPFYIRRIRVGKNEPVYPYFKTKAPGLVEDDVFDHSKGVISFPIRAPEGSIYRHETTLELLERVKRFNQEWIAEGHRSGDNTHNVSATISMRDHEWEKVGEWMWENKDFYNGLSVLPMDGGTYQQMPFEDSTEEKIIEMEAMLNGIDITEIKEEEDIIDFVEIISCDGEKCERVMVPH